MPPRTNTPEAPSGEKSEKLTKQFRNIDELPDASLLALPSVSQLLGISSNTIWRWSRSGLLKPIRIGSSTRWQLGDLRSMIRAGAGQLSQKIPPSVKRRSSSTHFSELSNASGGADVVA